MHKYLRAIGFSQLKTKKELDQLLIDAIHNPTRRSYTSKDGGMVIGEFAKDYADCLGVCACGEFDEEDKYSVEYYFPYIIGMGISSEEDVSIERHAANESYAGVCDDPRVGVTLIFYLQNMIPYIKIQNEDKFPVRGTTLTLSSLSVSGQIIMPLQKSDAQKENIRKKNLKRNHMINNARQGDERAIENLTLSDMDLYTTISKKLMKNDIYTLVDSYFMPYGVECDQYSVMGEIMDYRIVKNEVTDEKIVIMHLDCNGLEFDTAINQIDLLGEPEVGRRFKGTIWMQGFINFPNT